MTKTRRYTALLLSGLAVVGAACNTVDGVGEDLESAGDAAERVTDKVSGQDD